MSAWPEESTPSTHPPKPARTGAYLGVAALVIAGQALFFTGVITHLRAPKDGPTPQVLGLAAWQVAAAGFVSTLAGGLWLRKLV